MSKTKEVEVVKPPDETAASEQANPCSVAVTVAERSKAAAESPAPASNIVKITPGAAIEAWDKKKKEYHAGLIALIDAATAEFHEGEKAKKEIEKAEAENVEKLAADTRPFREQMARSAWKIARKIAEMRKKFEFRAVSRGEATPGSWPHFCRSVLVERGWLKDEKDASRLRLALEYLEQKFPDFEKKLISDEKLPAVPMPYEVVALKRVKDEKLQKKLHDRVFVGELSGRALFAALPKSPKKAKNPSKYEPGNVADDAIQTYKRALDSVHDEGDLVWIINASVGEASAEDDIKRALSDLGVTSTTRVCWAVWVKK
jgi:hypothetical protein